MATPTPPAADGSSPQQRKFDEEPPTIIDTDKRYVATMTTSHGTMVIALDPLAAPKAVNSFVFLVALPLLRRGRLPPHHPGVRPPRW